MPVHRPRTREPHPSHEFSALRTAKLHFSEASSGQGMYGRSYLPSSGCDVETVLITSQLTCVSASLALSQTLSWPGPQSRVSTWLSRASAWRTSLPSPRARHRRRDRRRAGRCPGAVDAVVTVAAADLVVSVEPFRTSLPGPPLMRSLSGAVDRVVAPAGEDPVTACERVDRVVPGPGQDQVVRRRSGERRRRPSFP